jgi:hypothetical protein
MERAGVRYLDSILVLSPNDPFARFEAKNSVKIPSSGFRGFGFPI